MNDLRPKVALGMGALAIFTVPVGIAGLGEAEVLAALTATTEGHVIGSRASESRECRGNGSERRCWTVHTLTATFGYEVDGRDYRGSGIGEPRSQWRTKDEAVFAKKRSALADGATVTIHDDPNAPHVACLEPEDAGSTMLLAQGVLGFGGLVFAGAIGVLVWWRVRP